MYDFLLLSEGETSSLDEKQLYLWTKVQLILQGEDTRTVAQDIIEDKRLTNKELRLWVKWLRENKPKLKTRSIDVFRGKIHK